MGFDVDPKKVICRYKQKVIINDLVGNYNGEVDFASDEVPNGRGVFQAENGFKFLGYFEHGKLGDGKCVIFDPQNAEYSACTRWHTDDGTLYEKGVKLG